MLARALGAGLFDKPPHYALSRVYSVISKGVVATLLDPSATVITVTYTGQPCTASCTAGPTVGWSNLDPERYHPLVRAQSLHIGPYATSFYLGLGGVVEYLAPNVTMTDAIAPTGTGGTGVLAGGGVVFDATECFNNMKTEAETEDIMVVNLDHLDGDPLGTIEDPTTGATLSLGDLFVQASLFLHAVADQLTVELALATKTGIQTFGPVNPSDPPVILPTVTTILS